MAKDLVSFRIVIVGVNVKRNLVFGNLTAGVITFLTYYRRDFAISIRPKAD